jgi:hypothetical protein
MRSWILSSFLSIGLIAPLHALPQRCDPAGLSVATCSGAFEAGHFEARDCRSQSPCPDLELCVDYKSQVANETLSATIPLASGAQQRVGVCSARPCTVNEDCREGQLCVFNAELEEAAQIGSGSCWMAKRCAVSALEQSVSQDPASPIVPCLQNERCVPNLRDEPGAGNCAPRNFKWEARGVSQE